MSRLIELEREGASLTLSDLVDAVKTNEEIVVTLEGRPVMRVLPADPASDRLQIGSAKGTKFWMADDFDDEISDFDTH